MTNVTFDYELPSGTILFVEAEIVSEGTPPSGSLNGLPEDYDSGESPEIEIVDCRVRTPGARLGCSFDPAGLWFRKFRSFETVELSDDIKDRAYDVYEEGK